MNWKEFRQNDKTMDLTQKGNYVFALLFIGCFIVGLVGVFGHIDLIFGFGIGGVICTVLYGMYIITKPIGYQGLTKSKEIST